MRCALRHQTRPIKASSARPEPMDRSSAPQGAHFACRRAMGDPPRRQHRVTGLGRKSSISPRMRRNRSRRTATSAIVLHPPPCPFLAPLPPGIALECRTKSGSRLTQKRAHLGNVGLHVQRPSSALKQIRGWRIRAWRLSNDATLPHPLAWVKLVYKSPNWVTCINGLRHPRGD